MREPIEQLFDEVAKSGWSFGTLKIWSESDFKCVYCDRDMIATLDACKIAKLDHILPQSRYPLLLKESTNLALCCDVCNRLKRNWDPNTQAGDVIYRDEPTLPPAQREELLRRARDHVKTQRTIKSEQLSEECRFIEAFRRRRENASHAAAEKVSQMRPS